MDCGFDMSTPSAGAESAPKAEAEAPRLQDDEVPSE